MVLEREEECGEGVKGGLSIFTSNKQVNSTSCSDLLFIEFAFSIQIFGIAIQQVDVVSLNVYMFEQVLPHECVIALRMVSRKIYNQRISYSEHTNGTCTY